MWDEEQAQWSVQRPDLTGVRLRPAMYASTALNENLGDGIFQLEAPKRRTAAEDSNALIVLDDFS